MLDRPASNNSLMVRRAKEPGSKIVVSGFGQMIFLQLTLLQRCFDTPPYRSMISLPGCINANEVKEGNM